MSPRSAASNRGVETQQRFDDRRLSQHHHRDDSDPTSDPEQRHPPITDGREKQNKEGSVVPPQAQKGMGGIPRLLDDESNNERNLANTEPSIQPSASQDRANLQHEIGRRRRRTPVLRNSPRRL